MKAGISFTPNMIDSSLENYIFHPSNNVMPFESTKEPKGCQHPEDLEFEPNQDRRPDHGDAELKC